jgi:DNA-binding transcriptional ArsR family regulator
MVVDLLDATFAALADPTRRRIVDRLARGPATVHELAAPFAMTQQAVSKHLACLERARLIEKRREGRENVCTLRAPALRAVSNWAEKYRRFWDESYQRLDALLEEMKGEDER